MNCDSERQTADFEKNEELNIDKTTVKRQPVVGLPYDPPGANDTSLAYSTSEHCPSLTTQSFYTSDQPRDESRLPYLYPTPPTHPQLPELICRASSLFLH